MGVGPRAIAAYQCGGNLTIQVAASRGSQPYVAGLRIAYPIVSSLIGTGSVSPGSPLTDTRASPSVRTTTTPERPMKTPAETAAARARLPATANDLQGEYQHIRRRICSPVTPGLSTAYRDLLHIPRRRITNFALAANNFSSSVQRIPNATIRKTRTKLFCANV